MRPSHCNVVIVLPVARYEPIVEELVAGDYLHVVVVDCGSTMEDYMLLLNVMHNNPSEISIIREDDAVNTSFGSAQGLRFAMDAFPKADFFVQTEPYFNNLEELLRKAEDVDVVVALPRQIGRRHSEFILGRIAGMNPHFLFSQVRCYTSASLRSLTLDRLGCTGNALQAEFSLRLWKKGYTFGGVMDDSIGLSRKRISLSNFSRLVLIAVAYLWRAR